MRKFILWGLCLMVMIPVTTNAKTLYRHLVDQLGYFPTVEERAPLAEECGIYDYVGSHGQNVDFKDCLEETLYLDDPLFNTVEDVDFGISVDKLSKTIREDITAGTNEATITVDPLVTLQGRRLTMADIASTSPRLFFRIGSGNDVTWGYCTGMTDNTTTYDLTGCQLGLSDYGPGTTVSTANINTHSAGEAFVITNQHHWFNYYFANVMSTSTIQNRWLFPTGYQHPRLTSDVDPTEDNQLAHKAYVDGVAFAGVNDASEIAKGILEVATQTEIASSTPAGGGDTTAPLALTTTYSTSTPDGVTTGKYVVVTENDKTINPEFFQSRDITFSGTVELHSTTTLQHGEKGSLVPVGTLLMYTATTSPPGWLVADGTAISRTDYSALFTSMGTKFGVGDGSTTFNLPDMRQRIPLGVFADSPDGIGSYIGENGGATSTDFAHVHTGTTQTAANGANFEALTVLNSSLSDNTETMNPYMTVNYIIKY